MERILVLGPCGAGKSTLAARLGEMLGLPVVHLDKEYWRAGWREPDPAEWHSRVEQLIARPRWVMDGNYGSTLARRLERAQMAVNLDYPRRVFFPRLLWRSLSRLGTTRPDMAAGCPERLDPEFLRYAWRYRKDVLPRREARIARSGLPVIDLKTPRETADWLAAGAPLDIARPRRPVTA
ncbi:MAG TPA: topology modulation protein [Croceibacterium sp.]|nr:topology modulation protein [Croceibacterium sp.]